MGRKEVEEETGLKGIKVAGIFAKRWKECPPEVRAKFEAPVKAEMAECKLKMAAYKKTQTYYDFQEKTVRKKYKKQPKDKNAPKRAMTSFFLYANSVRPSVVEELGGKNVAAIGKKIGEMWKALPAEEKAQWCEKQKQAKEKYHTVLAEYQKTEEFQEHQKNLKKWHENKRAAFKKLAQIKKSIQTGEEETPDIEEDSEEAESN